MAATIAREARPERLAQWRSGVKKSVRRTWAMLIGGAMGGVALLAALALASYHPTDPSLNTAAAGPVRNWIGAPGAWTADLLLSLWGPLSLLLLPLVAVFGFRIARGVGAGRWLKSLLLTALAMTLAGAGAALISGEAVNGLPAGWGGIFGLSLGKTIDWAISAIGAPGIVPPFHVAAIVLTAVGGAACAWFGLALSADERSWLLSRRFRRERAAFDSDYGEGEDDLPERTPRAARAAVIAPAEPARTVIADRVRAPERPRISPRDRQASLALGRYLPAAAARPAHPGRRRRSMRRSTRPRSSATRGCSNQCSRISTVKGEIVEVRPGPVVTMYELEPASGIKASRVIALADDIARNMSALSARVATIPGRSVIGIELPNAKREMVVLSELIASHAFEDQVAQLPIVLGKNIAGDPVVADLAPMPHLLVAGTTGSGKSVGLNCMILSLLYRLTPEQCKMIMIDPKMLELSIYDDIPHLLSPVVTEPRQGDPRAQMGGRADGGALSDDGVDRRPQPLQLQRQGARGQGQGPAARPPRPDRLRRRDRPADL